MADLKKDDLAIIKKLDLSSSRGIVSSFLATLPSVCADESYQTRIRAQKLENSLKEVQLAGQCAELAEKHPELKMPKVCRQYLESAQAGSTEKKIQEKKSLSPKTIPTDFDSQ